MKQVASFFVGDTYRHSIYSFRATVAEEEIKDAFTKNGFTVKAFKFFPKDRKMALIQMPNMDDAVAALIVSHHYYHQYIVTAQVEL